MKKQLSRQELIDLVSRIRNAENASEQEISEWLAFFAQNVPHPAASDLIYWPNEWGLDDEPSNGEIVDKALEYKSIKLE